MWTKINSFWTENEGKLGIINELKKSGYTIFSSNLYGRNWGSERAVELAQRLYHHVIRSEILNNRIHILAEGMGALVALKLMEKMNGQIRSVVLLNPVLSLKYQLELEKEHKFFYKKLIKELTESYQLDSKTLESYFLNMNGLIELDEHVPVKIIHVLSGGKSHKQRNQYQQIVSKTVIRPDYLLPEKKQQLGKIMMKFFNAYEAVL